MADRPEDGEVVFWTSDTGIDGEHPVELDELDLIVIDPHLAPGPDIDSADVADAVTDAQADIDAGLYAARWQRATRAEQRLLKAIAACAPHGGSAMMADLVAAAGKKKISQLSPQRAALIAKGLVYAPDRGELAFTVPGMATFAARQVIA